MARVRTEIIIRVNEDADNFVGELCMHPVGVVGSGVMVVDVAVGVRREASLLVWIRWLAK